MDNDFLLGKILGVVILWDHAELTSYQAMERIADLVEEPRGTVVDQLIADQAAEAMEEVDGV